METERKYNMVKLLVLPVIVFLVMQYQIDTIKAEQAATYYHERIQDVQDEIYRLEKDVYIGFQDIRRELSEHRDELNGNPFDPLPSVLIPLPDAGIDIRG